VKRTKKTLCQACGKAIESVPIKAGVEAITRCPRCKRNVELEVSDTTEIKITSAEPSTGLNGEFLGVVYEGMELGTDCRVRLSFECEKIIPVGTTIQIEAIS
jgi:phage FluMu protein Com